MKLLASPERDENDAQVSDSPDSLPSSFVIPAILRPGSIRINGRDIVVRTTLRAWIPAKRLRE